MRPRWQEWVIALAVIALGVTGVYTIWGNDLAQLLHPERAGAERSEGASGPAPAPPPAPAGPAQGPF